MADVDESRLLDAMPDGVVAADADGKVTHVNSVARDLLEAPRDLGIGSSLESVMQLQDLDGNEWLACTRPYDGLALRRVLLESSWLTRSGREVLVTARLLRERAGGRVRQVVVGLRDARARAIVDAERSNLVATVAHELRSPLTGVKGFTATLLSKWDRFNEEQKLLMLQTVDADADRLTRLIAELLDVARIDTGRLSLRKEPVDLVDAVSRQLGPLAAANGRDIEIDAPTEAKIWVDRDKLAQIVANLIENAVKHGEGAITVAIRSRDDGGAEIVVDDEGTGIPGEIRPRVFTKFWKHGPGGGTGLGLYIVGGLVAAHGGEVYVESAPGGGARMRVTLPHGQPDAVS